MISPSQVAALVLVGFFTDEQIYNGSTCARAARPGRTAPLTRVTQDSLDERHANAMRELAETRHFRSVARYDSDKAKSCEMDTRTILHLESILIRDMPRNEVINAVISRMIDVM